MTTIKLKNGSGAPLAGDLVQGEPALDLTNKRLYTEDSGGTVIEVGTNPTSLTTGTFTSTGIDDNAASTAITIDSSQNVGIGTSSPSSYQSNADNLVVATTGHTGITIASGASHLGNIHFADGTSGDDAYRGFIQYEHTANYMRFATNATEAMRIDSSGGVIFKGSLAAHQTNAGTAEYESNIFTLRAYGATSGTGQFRVLTGGGGGSAPTEAMRIDASGNVGIGMSPSGALSIRPSGSGSEDTHFGFGANLDAYITTGSSGNVIFREGNGAGANTEHMRIDSSGNVGIGVTNPSAYYSESLVVGAADEGGITIECGASEKAYMMFADGTSGSQAYRGYLGYDHNLDSLNISTFGYMNFFTGDDGVNTERMRINASGNLLWANTLGVSSSQSGIVFNNTTHSYIQVSGGSDTSFRYRMEFINGNGTVGTITTNGSATAYNTSSDYRLKENVVPLTGATERVKQLNPSRFNFIADADTTVDGFLAHEVADVVPEAISGTKDGMRDEEYEVTPAVYEDVVIPAVLDEEGNEVEAERTEQQLVSEAVMGTRSVPDYQGIDQSKLVPLLVATIQELEARITALESN